MASGIDARSFLQQLHPAIAKLSQSDIHSLQALGIQQAGRYGVRRDSRIFIIFGILSIVLASTAPLAFDTLILRLAIGFVGCALLIWSIKTYLSPSLADMRILMILLYASAIGDAIGTLSVLLTFQAISLAITVFWAILVAVQFRWAMRLGDAYQVAQTSTLSMSDTLPDIVSLYQQLSYALASIPPHPQNEIVHFGTGSAGYRMLLSQPYGIVMQQNGFLRVVSPNTLEMRLADADTNTQNELTFPVQMKLNERISQATVSQISYQTFVAWRKSFS